MDTAAVIGLVLAALLLGALLPVLFQLRATLRAAQETLEAAQRAIDDIQRMTPAVRSTLQNVDRISASLTRDGGSSSTFATLSALLPVVVSAFRAFTADDETSASPVDPPNPCPPRTQTPAQGDPA